ncbi:hypothetical protein KI688_012999 [Linnemannia hyalina]|uniref:Uncharacterized protein n=1 Tax=Linnemannia hyalina TaxID=64524 RepID=A0A9P7XTY4_9FUNG|nr:hypothetical protein KI688_012999 [Linnemannia hyalina]
MLFGSFRSLKGKPAVVVPSLTFLFMTEFVGYSHNADIPLNDPDTKTPWLILIYRRRCQRRLLIRTVWRRSVRDQACRRRRHQSPFLFLFNAWSWGGSTQTHVISITSRAQHIVVEDENDFGSISGQLESRGVLGKRPLPGEVDAMHNPYELQEFDQELRYLAEDYTTTKKTKRAERERSNSLDLMENRQADNLFSTAIAQQAHSDIYLPSSGIRSQDTGINVKSDQYFDLNEENQPPSSTTGS